MVQAIQQAPVTHRETVHFNLSREEAEYLLVVLRVGDFDPDHLDPICAKIREALTR